MTALHWIARHGRVGEADYIAPIVALRVEALAAKACRIAEDEARAVGRSGDGQGLSSREVAAAGQAAAAATRQRLNKDLGSDELGLWRDSTGAVPLHHLAYNPTAARDATTAQEMVAEVTNKKINQMHTLGLTFCLSLLSCLNQINQLPVIMHTSSSSSLYVTISFAA
jgi:hypothetical protein